MHPLLWALAVLLGGGVLCGVDRRGRLPWLGPATAVAGAAGALWAAAVSGASDFRMSWAIPFGSFHLGLDALSALFMAPIALVCGLAAIYGRGYFRESEGRRSLGVYWLAYNWLFAAMLVVVTARNGMLFLMAWEAMALSSFVLVVYDYRRPEVVRAGWIYLVATHIGTAFLLAMFCLLDRSGTMEFDAFAAGGARASAVFLLGLIGFGAKAGLMPMHVWLPEAHPAAPSHVSAVMSGVMIKTGVYGIVRLLTILGAPPEAWWGWVLLGVGACTGIVGVLFALVQRDLKRLLAYSSVENVGIVTMAVGLGVLGMSMGNPTVAVLAFGGAMLHILNHALFKPLLFLGAGAVLHAAGTRDLERLGGLMRRMPVTGTTFLVGAVAICGLPPLNGFVGEFLIFSASFAGIVRGGAFLAGAIVATSLALIGGLAAYTFVKAFGIAFLGEARDAAAGAAHEAPASMRWPMVGLAALCGLGGFGAVWAVRLVAPAVGLVVSTGARTTLDGFAPILERLMLGVWVLLGLVVVLLALRAWLLAGRAVRRAGTWDCGYAAPGARMQYTASSFSGGAADIFRLVLRTRRLVRPPEGPFPVDARVETVTDDVFMRGAFEPLFGAVRWVSGRVSRMQQGKMHVYVLYIAVTLLALLIWKLR